jgi:S1-C subfamily serine protease
MLKKEPFGAFFILLHIVTLDSLFFTYLSLFSFSLIIMPRPLEPDNAIDRDPLYRAAEKSNTWMNVKQATLMKQPSLLAPEQQVNKMSVTKKTTATWETTLEKCIKSIVSIKATRVRCLDTEIPGVFSATGFVVDAKRGIILSNRHVVSVSPIVAQAVLSNYEEIELKPIYRDPVHDFGFLQYDPSKVRFLDIDAIELYPEGARVGQEIRVVG